MNLEKFNRLNINKKNKIIQSAMDEFIKEGYASASTNIIVKAADISKGSLFNYFDNKENLYLYLVKINLDKLRENFEAKQKNIHNLNVVDGIKKFAQSNIEFFTENPKVFSFLGKAISDSPPEIRHMILEAKKNIQKTVVKNLIGNTDNQPFRKNISRENIEFIILNMLDILSNKYIELYKGDIKQLLKDKNERNKKIDEIIDIINYGIFEKR